MIRPLAPVREKPAKADGVDVTVTLSLNDGSVYRPRLRDAEWRLTQVSKPVRPVLPPPAPDGPFAPLPPPVF